jgi:predicted ferric reductase
MCLAAGFAVLSLRLKWNECFLILHMALVILTMVGCCYHLVPHFEFDYSYQVWLYLCFAFWSADRLARLGRLAFYNRFGSSKAIISAIEDSDIMQVTVFPRIAWGFSPGQHSFLYPPGLGKFWESHPFSVTSWSVHEREQLNAPASAAASNSSEKEAKIKES